MADAEGLLTLARQGFKLGGSDWYPDAERAISRLALETMRPVPEVADLVALTSPRQPVRQNVRIARALLRGELPGLLPNVAASLAYWRASGGAIRGPKVKAFRDALLGDTNSVVVDRHILDALGLPRSFAKRRGAYERAASLVREVAQELGAAPRETQAAIWCAQRASRGFAPAMMNDY